MSVPHMSVSHIKDYDNHIKDYDNGVYYFEYLGEEFAKSLSQFKAEHPELVVMTSAPDFYRSYPDYAKRGVELVCGYFVICEPREKVLDC